MFNFITELFNFLPTILGLNTGGGSGIISQALTRPVFHLRPYGSGRKTSPAIGAHII